ncbi:DUF6049 family protein [Glaciibacter flavus]|uniref:DUF6049 family protein n=1 Tax=Orlajensenia flava TaxID=2565934 RepID=UPI003B0080CB
MTAAMTPALRPAHRHPARARIVTALIIALLALALPLVSSPDAASAAESGVSVAVSAAQPQLGPGQDLHVDVTVTNAGSDAIAAGSLTLVLDRTRIATRSALDAWFGSDDVALPDGPSATAPTPRLLPAGTTVIPLTIPAASIGLDGADWGVRGLVASFTADPDTTAQGRGVLTWYAGQPVAPVPMAVVRPITAPPAATGVLSADDLTKLTRPGGILTRQLDGVTGREVAVGIDPMIIASIRVLGTAAPTSATDWLARLASLPNETFALGYADADPSTQAQAGYPALLAPTSLAYAIDAENFPAGATSTTNATPSVAPTPTPAPTTTPVPDLASLLAWNYSATGIAWPLTGGVKATDPAFFAASGLTTSIISSDDLASAPATTPRAAATAGGNRIALADARLSAAASRAATALTDDGWRASVDEAAAVLAVAATDSAGAPVLAALDRGWPPTSTRLPDTLDALSGLPWAAPAGFSTALAATPDAVALSDGNEGALRTSAAIRLATGEAQLGAFSSALADPAPLTGDERSRVLALLGVGWASEPADWATAVDDHEARTQSILGSVSVVPSSDVLVVGSPTHIPVTIKNAYSSPVDVTIRAVPSNGRLVVDQTIEATIQAGSTNTVNIPVTAQIGSGPVQLTVTAFSPTGVQLSPSSTIGVDVQADWEGLGALVIGVLAVGFFGIGIWRSIRRRRRERAAVGDGPADGAAAAGAEDATSDGAAVTAGAEDATSDGAAVSAGAADATSDGSDGQADAPDDPAGATAIPERTTAPDPVNEDDGGSRG